jgi:hypothetical protein
MSRKLKNMVNYMNNNGGSHSDYKDVTKFYGGMSFTKHNFKRKQTGGGVNDGVPTLTTEGDVIVTDLTLTKLPNETPAPPIPSTQTVANFVSPSSIQAPVPAVPVAQVPQTAVPAEDGLLRSQTIADPSQLLQQNTIPIHSQQQTIATQVVPPQQTTMHVPPPPITVSQQVPPALQSPVIPINPTTYNANAYLPLPHVDAQPYTIKAGTILYCGSLNRDHGDISATQIQTEHGNNLSFFTPNFRLAFGRIGECSINPDKSYVHAYEAKTDIPNIFVKHDFVTSMTFDDIQNNICANSKYNGVGFFYPANEIENFTAQITGMNTGSRMYAEFFLCNPFAYLVHLNTQKCIGTRKLGVIQQ